MRETIDKQIPRYKDLIVPTFQALKTLGGSGNNDDILAQIIADLRLSNEIVDAPHKGSTSMTELAYQAAWARTYLKNCGIISNTTRRVWVISPDFVHSETVDAKVIIATVTKQNSDKRKSKVADTIVSNDTPTDDGIEEPDEIKSWRVKLSEILYSMDPYGFERLAQRILRECGFSQVEVTKKSGDGGIDGTGKLKINGIFSFNVAFQCKRYSGIVGASAIRDFRGSLTTDIEKGVLITTGTFSKAAKEEASNPGKQQIDLIDGEELMNKIAEYGIGVREVIVYEIDEEFFAKI